MELAEFVGQVPQFDQLAPRAKIHLFAWYLHVHAGKEVFANADVRNCFSKIHLPDPNVARDLPRLADKKPPDLIRVRDYYKLSGTLRRALDLKYGVSPRTIFVTELLSDLPSKVPNLMERTFLAEAIDCYRVEAYRATTVMAWNLAFDHLLRWIIGDKMRLVNFNAAITKRFPKKSSIHISTFEDFEELKESETIEICGTANLMPKATVDVLREKLKRRNTAAHPSQVVITQGQVDDTITDLVYNVVLPLKI